MSWLRNLLNAWGGYAGGAVQTPTPEVRVIYVNVDRALNEASKLREEVTSAIARQRHFIEWLRSNKLRELLDRAFANGSSQFTCRDFGDAWWVKETVYAEMLDERLRRAGFKLTREVHESDGPESDTVAITIEVLK